MWDKSKNAGFTLIELLIVIVIIGILATLIINFMVGAQKKARNARTIANVRQFYTAMKSFQASTGYFPYVEGPPERYDRVRMVCIGLGYPQGRCGRITGTNVAESQYLYDQLKEEAIGIGTEVVNIVSGDVANESFTGAAYGIDTVYQGGYGRTIQWFLEGEDADCGVSTAYTYNTATGNSACEILLEHFE